MYRINLVRQLYSRVCPFACTIVKLLAILKRIQSSLDPTTPVIKLPIGNTWRHQVHLRVVSFGRFSLQLPKQEVSFSALSYKFC